MRVPTILPSAQQSDAPLPEERIQAPPGAFAGNVLGQDFADAGKTAGQASSDLAAYATQHYALDNKLASDTAFTNLVPQMDSAWAEFKANNQGVDPETGKPRAIQNLPDFYKNLEQMRQDAGAKLSPLAQADYEAASRRYFASVQSEATNYAVGERHKALVGGAQAVIKTNQAIGVSSEDGSDASQNAIAEIGKQTAFLQNEVGWTDAEAKEALHESVGAIYTGQVKMALDSGEQDKANHIFDTHKGDMTSQQIEQVAGALKLGNQTEMIDRSVNSYFGSPTGVSVQRTPSHGGPTAGADMIRTDPAGVLKGLVGVPVTVTSEGRSTDHNKEVGGSSTSEHLTSNAWDFVPQGLSMDAAGYSLAHALESQGISFDQVEVTGNHVHVGFGDKNRGEVIDGSGKVLPPPTGQGMAQTVHGPHITSGMDPDDIRANGGMKLLQDAQTLFPGNDRMQELFISKANRRLELLAGAAQANLNQSYGRLGDAIIAGDIKDETTLAKSYPGATSDLAMLTPRMRYALRSDLSRNDRDMSDPARQALYTRIDGEKSAAAAGTDNTFMRENIWGLDLPLATKKTFQGEQDKLKAKQTIGGNVDKIAATVMSSKEAQADMDGLGIDYHAKEKPDDYWQMYGTLKSGISQWIEANNGAVPKGKDLDTIRSHAVQQTTKPSWFGIINAGHEYDVPDWYMTQAHSQGYTNMADISQAWHDRVARTGNGRR